MVTASEMYWLTRLDSIKAYMDTWAAILTVLGGIALLIAIVIKAMTADGASDDDKEAHAVAKRLKLPLAIAFTVGVLLMTATVFIPNTKEYAAIKVVPALLNDGVKEDFGDLYGLGMEWAKDAVKANLGTTQQKK